MKHTRAGSTALTISYCIIYIQPDSRLLSTCLAPASANLHVTREKTDKAGEPAGQCQAEEAGPSHTSSLGFSSMLMTFLHHV